MLGPVHGSLFLGAQAQAALSQHCGIRWIAEANGGASSRKSVQACQVIRCILLMEHTTPAARPVTQGDQEAALLDLACGGERGESPHGRVRQGLLALAKATIDV
jgi:hypothetical protein